MERGKDIKRKRWREEKKERGKAGKRKDVKRKRCKEEKRKRRKKNSLMRKKNDFPCFSSQ